MESDMSDENRLITSLPTTTITSDPGLLVLLRYSLQKNYIAIPKSASKTSIISNINICDFQLEPQEVMNRDGLEEALIVDWDPSACP
ncbi:Aldo/keto reductase [Mycena venus]|uniref:Aldo/keto reductase n=1 Tax=Mycena venus TaxID=2733690 RepID=A0A8H6YE64_9AGAR|nr:Aldo/keto reductase [Mycena venus]